ncbi:hypothetical protein JHK85_019660 [Glycine max]|nr:hypothetical protein JHK85_019660 [Glycine max]
MPTPTPPPPPPKNPGRATEDGDEAKENTDPQQVFILLPVLYGLFSFAIDNGTITGNDRNRLDVSNCSHVAVDNDKRDQSVENATTNKKADSDSEEEENVNEQKEKGISNKKKKLQRQMKIAELKQIFSRPDVVELWFLLGKRGIEKPPFQLPDFIAATGIEKIRQVFHDVFFNYQTKPKRTSLGDLYHEGKEFEISCYLVVGSIAYVAGAIREICLLEYQVKLREMKPGMLSHELKEALGIPEGAPPPWLINMQVLYGPPSSYPHLKIPGLNAPIPPGASFGYHPGGWGKPPVDEYGSPLYGDVFGVHQQDQPNYEEEPVDKTKHWGDLEEEEEVEDESEEMEEEELEAGIQSVDSLSSTPTGVETHDVIDLRKLQRKEPEKPLYQVDLLRGQKSDKVDVTLLPEELDAKENVLSAKYEEAREEGKS